MGYRRRSFGPREMSKAVCSDCGEECEVPFKPTEEDRSTVRHVGRNIDPQEEKVIDISSKLMS